jgi:hypothetical protein
MIPHVLVVKQSQESPVGAEMPTFIDESGDTGWLPGALPYFRLAAVWLPTPEVISSCMESICRLRRELKLGPAYEFKFARTDAVRRRAFFKAVLEHEFRFAVSGYDKSRMESGSLDPRGFHWGCAVALATDLKETYLKAEADKAAALNKPTALNDLVVVDDNQDRRFLAEIKKAFRALESRVHPGGKLIGKVKFRDSGRNDMLQLVDMTLGASGAKVDGDDTWYDLISSKCVGLTCIPKK